MKKKILISKKFSKIKKIVCSNLLKTICCTAFLIFSTSTVSAVDYTWVGGVAANDMADSNNWNPSGPPGANDNALFTTLNNPPNCPTGVTMSVNNFQFLTQGVVCTVEGDLSAENGIENGAGISSIFNLQNEGIFTLDGGSLADGGVTTYNLDFATLDVASADDSAAIVNMQNGSVFTVEEILTIGSLSSASSSDSIDLQADLTFGNSTNQTINGAFSGTENLIKQGTGTVSLNGANTIGGLTSVQGGRLNVNGSVSGNMTVFSDAIVGGTGTIGGLLTVQNGGTLSPGNSIGTITLGSLSLGSSSITNIEIDPTASSQIIVTGNATLGGSINVIQNTGTYAKTGSYEILTAGSITDDFSSVTGGFPGFAFSFSTLANQVFLNYTLLGISTSTLSGNNLLLANYLNASAPGSPEFIALAGLSGDSLNAALSAVSPARNAFPTFASQQTAFSLSDIVSGYLSNRRFTQAQNIGCPCVYSCSSTSPYTVWGGGFFQHARQSTEKQNPAFNFNSEGIVIGVDCSRSYGTLVGAGLGYAHTNLSENQHAGNASIDYYCATIYGMINRNRFYIEPALWGIAHHVHNHRHISYADIDETAHATFNGWQFISHLGIGSNYQYCFAEVEPFVALDWVANWENSFHEHGANNLNMRQKAQTSSMLQSEVGLRFYEPLTFCWGLFGAKENISYINRTPFNTGKVTAAILGASDYLTLESLTSSQNLAAVGLELFFQFGKNQNYTASLEYEGEFGSNYQSNAGKLRISVEF